MRSERYTEVSEITKNFKVADGTNKTAGPIILCHAGTNYYDDSESHIIVDGRTGMGKSGCVSTAYAINVLKAEESLICIDPKGDLYERTAYIAEKKHRVICLDFRNPRRSPDQWNPLLGAYKYYTSSNPEHLDIACSQISEIAHSLYPTVPSADPFWNEAAANYFTGLTYALFDSACDKQINMDSIAEMMDASEIKCNGSFLLKDYVGFLSEDSMAKRHLVTYTSAPNDTRASIHSVAANSLSQFSRSKGLMEMLSQDTVDINNLDVYEKPVAIYCLIPDFHNTYDTLAGIFMSQLTQHFIQLAHDKYSGKLPNRINIILEELSSVGKSISSLPNLMVAARSRNIRLMLVLQDGSSQLEEVYGRSSAATINASIGVTFAFSTNSWTQLNTYSQRVGDRQIEVKGQIIKEPLITACQLAAMPIATALVLINNQYKFITKFPFYNKIFDMSGWHAPTIENKCTTEHITFNLEKCVEEKRAEKVRKALNTSKTSSEDTNDTFSPSFPLFDKNDLIAKIDARIAELEKEVEIEETEKKSTKICSVVITRINKLRVSEMVDYISDLLEISKRNVLIELNSLPVKFTCESPADANSLIEFVKRTGGQAELLE